ncbi:coiled-coil domain-containing protein 27 [Mixophyes fleayi]|uniref:coiled-coil domain-containing protein 27 n=1 Tax=Mixophyes fleayi TaxID=3061075 RepID=UPI003F4DEF40
MKENTGWKMQSFHELQWTGSRRPQTAVWRIPKSDTRRDKYSKSAREHGHSSESQSPICSPSPAPSYESNSSSRVIDLHTPNGTSNGFCKLSNFSFPTDRKLPHIQHSADLAKSNVSTGSSSINLHFSGNQSIETYLTSVDIKTPWYISVLNDKEHCLLKLGEEINRLSRYEVECKRKDHIISTLRAEISHLQSDLHQILHSQSRTAEDDLNLNPADHVSSNIVNGFPTFEGSTNGSPQTEESLDSRSSPRDLSPGSQRNVSTISLAGSFSEIQRESQMERESLHADIPAEHTGNVSAEQEETEPADGSVDRFDDGSKVIQQLQEDIELRKKDYEILKGVISSLQKLVSSHESKLRKSESEREVLERELRERAMQIQAMSHKFSSMREDRKHEELMATMETENYSLRELVSELKSEVTRRNDMIADFKSDVHRLQKEVTDYQTQKRKHEGEKSQLESRMLDLATSEQHVKVSLEILQTRFERFRSKIMQAAYTAPGFKGPQVEISDTEILDTMQKIIADRSDFHQQLKQKGVNVPPLYVSEMSTATKQTSSTRRKAA